MGLETPPPGATRLDGVTLPGLANAHSHAFQRALRGRAQGGGGSFWTWREEMYRLAGRLDPDTYRALARATYAEMALAGITCVGEFHYLHHDREGNPYDDPNETGAALMDTAAEAGIRITLLDACYLHGGFGEPPQPEQLRFCDASAEAWAERVSALEAGPGARIGAAVHSVRAVDPESAAQVASFARENGMPLHAHLSEQASENEGCLEAHGASPTEVLRRAGALDAEFTAVHATHLGAGDVAALGAAGACCCVCPTTERDLADGIGLMRPLAEAGAKLALGSDSHAVIDLFEEARALELDERLATGRRGLHAAPALLHAATAGGHASLGWADAGRIAPGARADLVTVALDGVRLAGADPASALEAVVFAAGAADVRHVLANGRELVADGRHLSIDVVGELREAIAAVTG